MRKYVLIFLAGLVLYALLGFFAAPALLTAKLPEIVQNSVKATLSLGKVQVNPFTLSVTAQDIELRSLTGEPLAAAQQLHLNLQASSVVRQALYLKKLELTGPRISAERDQSGRLNLMDLAPEPSDSPEPATKPLRVKVDELTVRSGHVGFAEQRSRSPFETLLDQLEITVRDLDTLPNHEGQFSFQVGTEENGRLGMTGQLSVDPLIVTLAVDVNNIPLPLVGRYLDESLPLALARGDVSSRLNLQISANPFSIDLTQGTVNVSDLAMNTRDTGEELTTVGSLELTGLNIAYPQQTVDIERIALTGGKSSAWIETDGTTSWSALTADSTEPSEETSPWAVSIAELQLADYALSYADRSLGEAADFALTDIDLNIAPLSTVPDTTSQLSLAASPGSGASIRLEGELAPLAPSLDAQLTLDRLDLSQVQPYLSEHTGLALRSGLLSTQGKLLFGPAADAGLTYSGEVQVDTFDLGDKASEDSLSTWKKLTISQLVFASQPTQVQIESIVLSEPYARVIIKEDRTSNLQAALTSPQATEPDAEPVAQAAPAQTDTPANITVGAVEIQNGSLFFSDRSLTPRFETGIEDLNGSISELSSESLSKAEVDLSGSVDRYAPVSIKGQINPLSEAAFTDITLDFDGIELTTFSPYSGRFAGHRIRKGKLNLDLRYKLNASLLEGENRIFLNQLALGDRVDSPDATGLPVGLAIALLKDRDGNIDLDIPVRGDLDDPEFSLGGVVLKAFVGLITKVVTSPFGIFGKLIPGGGEDLQFVDFAPGAAVLGPDQVEKLAGLADGLYQRPGLSLEIAGKAHPDVDGLVLARRTFALSQGLTEADIGGEAYWYAVRAAAQAPEAAAQPDEADPDATVSEPDLTELETTLLSGIMPSDDDLRSLASERAQAIRQALFEAKEIETERVFLLAPAVVPGSGEPVVRIEMSLGTGS